MAAELFPAFIKLEGRACLVVGAGAIAISKIDSLLRADARVSVVAPYAKPEVVALAAENRIVWHRREFRREDLSGVFLSIAATTDNSVNRAVYFESQSRGVLCNAVDDPPHCDFYFPAVVRRGDLQIAISTAGESPSVARRFRLEIESALDETVGDWLHFVGALRREIMATQPPSEERKKLLNLLAYSEVCDRNDCEQETRSIELAGRHVHLPEHLPNLLQKHQSELVPAETLSIQEQP
jgi:precorrin-2 dehydrogenase / sirohydrochlorin ferrochelatase